MPMDLYYGHFMHRPEEMMPVGLSDSDLLLSSKLGRGHWRGWRPPGYPSHLLDPLLHDGFQGGRLGLEILHVVELRGTSFLGVPF